MTVRKRTWKNKDGTSSSCWMVDITYDHPNGQVERIRKTAPGTTKREAEAYERQILGALISGTYGTHKEVPLYKDFYELWERDHCMVHLKHSTQRNYQEVSKRHLLPTYGHLRLNEITTREVAAHQAQLLDKGKLRPATVNTILGSLISQLSTAVSWGLLESAPSVHRIKAAPKELHFLDFDEADRLVKAAGEEDPELQALVILALKTGMRIGELTALKWTDIDLIKQVLTVRRNAYKGVLGDTPKSGKSRDIPLTDGVVEALKAQRLRSALRGEFVFSDEKGAFLNFSNNRTIARICRSAGLRVVGWHVLRHTFASHLVQLAVPLKAVQELLGHSTMEMTMRYAHLAAETLNTSVQLLDTREFFGTTKAQKELSKIVELVKP